MFYELCCILVILHYFLNSSNYSVSCLIPSSDTEPTQKMLGLHSQSYAWPSKKSCRQSNSVSSYFSTWPIRSGLYIALKRLICRVAGHGLHSLSLCLFLFYLESSKSSASFHSSRVQLPCFSVGTFPRTEGLSSGSHSPGETSVLVAPAGSWLFRWEPEEPTCWAGGHGSSQ